MITGLMFKTLQLNLLCHIEQQKNNKEDDDGN
jgi:hypothetical protein